MPDRAEVILRVVLETAPGTGLKPFLRQTFPWVLLNFWDGSSREVWNHWFGSRLILPAHASSVVPQMTFTPWCHSLSGHPPSASCPDRLHQTHSKELQHLKQELRQMADELQQSRGHPQKEWSISVPRVLLWKRGAAEPHPDLTLCTECSRVSRALVMCLTPGSVSSAFDGIWCGFQLLGPWAGCLFSVIWCYYFSGRSFFTFMCHLPHFLSNCVQIFCFHSW